MIAKEDKTDKLELLNKWIKTLNLTDWTIDVTDDCVPSDFRLENVCGECEYDIVNKTAVIRILSPKCYGERIIPYNYEQILIHELLHIKFSLIYNTNDRIHDMIVHQLIEEFAKILSKERSE